MRNVMLSLTDVRYVVLIVFSLTNGMELAKEEVDKVIEDEITQKLSEDLLQSIERKFQVDLERSVDSVLLKIKMLLQNGTAQIQDNLLELQGLMGAMKKNSEAEVDACLIEKQSETAALAEKALHQMVVCGYALIGHDPAQAVKNVMSLKNMIKQGLKPIYEQKKEVNNLLTVCGHDHDSLKKVIKCVISKSPLLKTSMMDITGRLIDGVVHLTKLMAHGAMHEACLIEVIKTVEDEAYELIRQVKACAYGNETYVNEVHNFINENNATVLDIKRDDDNNIASDNDGSKRESADNNDENKITETKDMKELLRRMLSDNNNNNVDVEMDRLKEKFMKMQKDLDKPAISNDIFDNK